ncbi:hypothetical protein [Terriglobus sp.]|uniref:hypothetical protein n=1 Tax=Terriglobus sp. TaxID=1889013 RepID=UPI003B009952
MSELSTLQGEELAAVEFVERFVQLRFSDSLLRLYVWPDVADADGISIAFGEPGYRDALCSLIGETATTAALDPGRSLTIEFENGTLLAMSLRDEDLDTPEAGSFTAADGSSIDF